MLILYPSIPTGGVETFFLRLSKERARRGLATKFLLYGKQVRTNKALVNKLSKYATIYYSGDIFYFSRVGSALLSMYSLLFLPINENKMGEMLEDVSQIHVTSGFSLILSSIIQDHSKTRASITIGIYSSRCFTWGDDLKLPYFEVVNRRFFTSIPKRNIIFFNEKMIKLHDSKLKDDFSNSTVFPIGVINSIHSKLKEYKAGSKIIRVCSIGRLVNFKTYNLWMLDVLAKLQMKGYQFRYDIYGSGDMQTIIEKRIELLGLNDIVTLKGHLDYEFFDKTILDYDLFVGSGTAIIQAASLGVFSIAAIDSSQTGECAGYFSGVDGTDYVTKRKDKTYKSPELLIENFINLNLQEKKLISDKHVEKSKEFSIERCVSSFIKLDRHYFYFKKKDISVFRYIVSKITSSLFGRLKGYV